MTFLAAAPAVPFPADVDHTTYRMPTSPRLVEPAPVQDPAITTPVAGAFGELWIDDRTPVCPWCFEDLGSEWCCCAPATLPEVHPWRTGR